MKAREILIWVAVAGAIVVGYLLVTDKREAKASEDNVDYQERVKKRKAVVAAGPIVKVLPTAEGDVIEIAIPSLRKGRFLEIRHCTAWRDGKTRTTSLSCEEDNSTNDYEAGSPPIYAD
jgi:hypothetical protein